MSKVSRRDVADAAGVSVAAVTYAFDPLSNGVSPETRQRILAIAVELGYHPNALAAGLRRGQTNLVGMMVPDLTNPFFSELATAVEHTCAEYGLMLLVASVDNDPVREEQYMRSLANLQVRGAVVTSTSSNGVSDTALEAAMTTGVRVVSLDRASQYDAQVVATDNHVGGVLAARHLIGHGRRHVVCIAGPLGLSSSDGRVRGFQHECASLSIPVSIVHTEFSYEEGYRAAQQLLSAPGPQMDGIFVASDIQAIGVLHALQDAGVDVPSQVSLIGYDGTSLGTACRPRLTTVRQPVAQLAIEAVTRLLTTDAEASRVETLVAPDLVRRESCGCVWESPAGNHARST